MKEQMHFEKAPVAVYDVEMKKCVAIFSSLFRTAMYVFDNPQMSRRINRFIINKSRLERNKFNRPLAFRKANSEQIQKLGTNDFLILDPLFELQYLKNKQDSKL